MFKNIYKLGIVSTLDWLLQKHEQMFTKQFIKIYE